MCSLRETCSVRDVFGVCIAFNFNTFIGFVFVTRQVFISIIMITIIIYVILCMIQSAELTSLYTVKHKVCL